MHRQFSPSLPVASSSAGSGTFLPRTRPEPSPRSGPHGTTPPHQFSLRRYWKPLLMVHSSYFPCGPLQATSTQPHSDLYSAVHDITLLFKTSDGSPRTGSKSQPPGLLHACPPPWVLPALLCLQAAGSGFSLRAPVISVPCASQISGSSALVKGAAPGGGLRPPPCPRGARTPRPLRHTARSGQSNAHQGAPCLIPGTPGMSLWVQRVVSAAGGLRLLIC